MRTVQEYREYAEGCRALAAKLTDTGQGGIRVDGRSLGQGRRGSRNGPHEEDEQIGLRTLALAADVA
jgi:hypothetical protein